MHTHTRKDPRCSKTTKFAETPAPELGAILCAAIAEDRVAQSAPTSPPEQVRHPSFNSIETCATGQLAVMNCCNWLLLLPGLASSSATVEPFARGQMHCASNRSKATLKLGGKRHPSKATLCHCCFISTRAEEWCHLCKQQTR